MPFFSRSALKDGVAMREVWSWAAFDFANSGYTTVVLTAVFNAYFVSVVAGDAPSATFLWTVVIAVSNAVSMLPMPVIGTVADATATKKRWLAVATFMAVGGTLGLMFAGPGTIVWASLMIIVSNVAYNVGESLNSAFLPELAREDAVGKVSGWGWSFGYCGGILTLGLCLGVVLGGEKLGYGMDQTVAGTMAVTAFVFAAAALPIFLFLKERSVPRLDGLAVRGVKTRHARPSGAPPRRALRSCAARSARSATSATSPGFPSAGSSINAASPSSSRSRPSMPPPSWGSRPRTRSSWSSSSTSRPPSAPSPSATCRTASATSSRSRARSASGSR